MATKTWKLGEVCKGGIITTTINKKTLCVIGKDWDYSKGTRRSSDQSGAKEWIRFEIPVEYFDTTNGNREVESFLLDLTTSYHTGKIMDWFEIKK